MPPKIVFDSDELLSCGAQITEIVLYGEQPRSYGRTRVSRTEEQRPFIALGGFAAEYRLFRAGCLVKLNGDPPTEKEFISYAMGNATEDRINFFGGDHQQPDGYWPTELDRAFIGHAVKYADTTMRFDLVEQIAAELLALGKLDEASIQKITASYAPALPKPQYASKPATITARRLRHLHEQPIPRARRECE